MMSTNDQARSDGLEDFPARFDDTWTNYDADDLAAINVALPALGFRADDVGPMVARQLDYVKARVYSRRLPAMSGDLLVPTESDVPEGAETIVTKIFDEIGMAKVIANYADDLPRADVRGREVATPIRSVGDSYGYSQQDLRASAFSGMGLPAMRAEAARRAVEQKSNRIKFQGDPVYGLQGILTHPNVPVVVPTTGNWAAAGTTGDQIVADAIALIEAIPTQSNGIHAATVVGMDNVRMAAARTKRLTADRTITAGQFLQQLYPNVQWVVAQELGTTVFAAERDATNYRYEQVMPFRQYPPQARNLEFVVPCEARTGGVVVNYPLSMAKMTVG
jgi:hypothetical protein